MANDTVITVVGNLVADPELRWTQSGHAVANFTIASTPRTFDKQRNEWVDGEALFLRSSIWRDAAESVAESLEKGSRVIAQGRLVQRSYTDKDGNDRTRIELQVDEIGPSLRYATAQVAKVAKGGGARPPHPADHGTSQSTPPQQDSWAGGGNQGGYDDQPPPF